MPMVLFDDSANTPKGNNHRNVINVHNWGILLFLIREDELGGHGIRTAEQNRSLN